MKYFKVFNTESEYLAYVSSEDFISPNVSTLYDSSKTWINAETHDYSKDYFTIESLEDDNEIKFGRSVGGGNISELHIAASTDNGSTWTEYSLPYESGQYDIATINSGDKIIFKYISGGFKYGAYTNTYFVTSGSFNVYGNVMSLVKAGNFSDATTSYGVPFLLKNSKVVSAKNLIFPKNASIDANSHYGMFSGCTSLIEAPELPATTLATSCYSEMFRGCTSLTETPELPATTLAKECYYEMFKGCTSLTATTELAATTLAIDCYRGMFDGCTSLTTTPELPATTLATRCYRSMFGNCTNLEEAPELPATTLADDCYHYMFGGCTSLTTAPELPATTLAIDCYMGMFDGCTSLTTAPSVLPAATVSNKAYYEMFKNCTSLTTAPSISATSFGSESCRGMFYGCTSLTTIQETLSATTLGAQCCRGMYMNCTSLTTAPELLATTLANSCYYDMFNGCSALTTAQSVLPATTLEINCYHQMFYNCKSLVTAPTLSAETVAASACTSMFSGCTALTTVQSELPATTMADYCYHQMFKGCTSLTVAPELPATTLASRCYNQMFYGCTSLTTAPELPAITLVDSCYYQMFKDCNKLNYIKCLATNISATDCTKEWVYHVQNSSGTFVKHISMSDWTKSNTNDLSNSKGIPSAWTVVDYSDVHVTGVAISSTAETITKGNSVTLTATVLPNDAFDKSVTWSTSDSTVATVSNDGLVTAVGCGNATITVTTHDGGYTAQCTTTVENPVTGVSLNTNILTILTGLTYQLEATVSPSDACGDKSVTWSSSDSNIASVSNNGLVTAVSTGSAVITVTTTVGSHTATCAVEVSEPVAVTGVTLSESTLDIVVGQTSTLTATVLPNNATNKNVIWSSSDSNVATVDGDGVVSGVASGNAAITVTTVDGGFTAQCSVSVSHDYSKDYFTIESLEDNNAITFVITSTTTGNLGYYSTDNGTTWTQIESGSGAKTIATLNSGDTVLIKATSQTSGQQAKWATDYNKNSYFNATKTYKIYGNAMSLLTGDDFETATTITQEYALCGLFFGGNNSTKLLDASNLVLPATGLTKSSYNGMFRGCKALQHGPKLLPALVVPQDGYSSMFESGTSLVEAPEIMATTVSGNTALNRMFCMARSGSVTAALTKGPVLRITNPSSYANTYQQLFAGNPNITEVTILAQGTNLSFANWLSNVSSSGVIKKLSATTFTSGASGVPSGWSTKDID